MWVTRRGEIDHRSFNSIKIDRWDKVTNKLGCMQKEKETYMQQHAWALYVCMHMLRMSLIKVSTNVYQKRVSIQQIITPNFVNNQTNFTSGHLNFCVFLPFVFCFLQTILIHTYIHTYMPTVSLQTIYMHIYDPTKYNNNASVFVVTTIFFSFYFNSWPWCFKHSPCCTF